MRTIQNGLAVLFGLLFISVLASCEKSNPEDSGINPFSNGRNVRNMLVVISDLHLGADLSYAEFNKNTDALVKILNRIKDAPDVKELIIGGDLVDEWFVPATTDTYLGKDQADFVKRVASSNKAIFDVLNGIIQDGKIRVTYVPGNHDLTITAAHIESILPGINQARDAVLGLGTYSPADCPLIAIEHGHRYNFFCAPDPYSNQDIAPGTIMPPGYFFTRIGALCKKQGHPIPADTLPVITENMNADESQDLLYRYWKNWYMSVHMFPLTNHFDEKIIVTGVNGLTGTYSINDLVPYQSAPGGPIGVNVSHGIQDSWEARQTHNLVNVHIPTEEAIDSVISNTETDHQAILQYFMNPAANKRIVVFGHTHDPRIVTSYTIDQRKCVYANAGTWIDNNPGKTTMNFVVITPQSTDASSQTLVKLYNFEKEVVTEMSKDSLRY
jgi:UDP-2,3-diacylglucosamine pyrophosphatase LpxH